LIIYLIIAITPIIEVKPKNIIAISQIISSSKLFKKFHHIILSPSYNKKEPSIRND